MQLNCTLLKYLMCYYISPDEMNAMVLRQMNLYLK